jgi:hypothetical protein
MGIGTAALEDEAVRRAYHGVEEPVFYKGVQCGSVTSYSDTLLMFLLKARKPAVYRDGYCEGGAPTSITINVETVDKRPEPLPVPAIDVVTVPAQPAVRGR